MKMKNTRQELLLQELREYEAKASLSKDERDALREWVKNGNSIHENPCMAEDGHGRYLDFIDVYRTNAELGNILDSLTEKERENYLARFQRVATIDDLRDDLMKMTFRMNCYEDVLRNYGLLDEALEYCDSRMAQESQTSVFDNAHDEPLPFD